MPLTDFLIHLRRMFYKQGLPLSLVYFITSHCNLKCAHCFYWEELNKNKNELTREEVINIAKSLSGLMSVSLTGGEPFLREDLPELAQAFVAHSGIKNVQINSNGMQPEKVRDITEKILSLCKGRRVTIGISLDGLEKTHNEIRGNSKSFQCAINTFRHIKELKKKYNNLHLGSITTVSARNQHELLPLLQFIHNELDPDGIGINLIRGVPRATLAKDGLDIHRYFQFGEEKRRLMVRKLKKEGAPFLDRVLLARESLSYDLISKIYVSQKPVTPCYAGSLLAVMYEEGDVYPCEMLSKKMGNIRDSGLDFRKLWSSERAKEVRRFIQQGRCVCTYECAMTSINTLFNSGHCLKIVRDAVTLREHSPYKPDALAVSSLKDETTPKT